MFETDTLRLFFYLSVCLSVYISAPVCAAIVGI